ncbi:MAG: exodeoxyribonuclease subunit beta [Pseudomonadota bacterium]
MTDLLDPLTLPLSGSRLIEASAGTGKTWTIAALYLRLVLGHGDHGRAAGREARPLGPSQILVMTFTRAATRELSDRIRARLIEAAQCFRGAAQPAPHDTFLHDLIADHGDDPEDDIRSQAAYRLALAAEAMDEAAVHTIDAWCQRMLREHAFDSGNLFNEELVADEAELLAQAMHDVWRREVYPLETAPLAALLGVWPSVAVMQQQVQPLLHQTELLGADTQPRATLADWLPAWVDERHMAVTQLKTGWADKARRIAGWINAQQQGQGGANPFNGNLLRASSLDAWIEQIVAWADDPDADLLVLSPDTGRTRLTPDGIVKAYKKGHRPPPLLPEFAEFEALQQALDMLEPLAPRLLRHLTHRVARRLDQLKRRSARFGFADLQARLDQALSPEAGEAGERLRQSILAQYPVALIDEFQDTSPLQYRLFDRLYRVADHDPATALLLIGDPKQSIYGFRGADIYSYLQVRQATEGRHHVLGTNFRSTRALIGAVNTVFAQAERRWSGGAFAFAKGGPLALPFEPVEARGRSEVLVRGEALLPALTARALDAAMPQRALTDALAQHAAEQLVDWLNDATVGFRAPDGAWQRLAPGHVAVLVRSRREADAVRLALRRRGVSSVYLSDQDSVFASAEAADLLRWLQAVADPLNAPLARAAYATATVGLDLEALARLVTDELAWDVRLAQLQRLRGVWQRQGVLTLVRQTLHALDLPARWLGAADAPPDGERRLTNLLHLGELLQAAAAQLDGEQAQIRWLAEQIHGFGGAGDERVVRLESDAELVQVVTVHKSKGLEYPVVFMPFASSCREVDRRGRRFIPWVDHDGTRALDFTLSDDAMASADRERLREDLRLLYVALTRARHALWLGVGFLKNKGSKSGGNKLDRSALGYLLGGGLGELSPALALERLNDWAVPHGGVALPGSVSVETLPARPGYTRLRRAATPVALAEAPRYQAAFDRRWTVGSFSALVRDLRSGREAEGDRLVPASSWAVDPARNEQLREEWLADLDTTGLAVEVPAPVPVLADAAWHRFPKGALAGNFLHELLQWLAEEGFDRWDTPAVQAFIRRRCERHGHTDRADEVVAWMGAVLTTPLPVLGGAALSAIGAVLPEMEFWMPSVALRSAALDRVCRERLLPGQARPALVPRVLQGLLMGFADLVFEHGGRWWVLDYKSNHLGDGDADYHAAALDTAMLAHRYDLQAALYLLALHRLLRQRLGDGYDPALHLGGAVYLFLRGVRGPQAGCVVVPAPLALLDALDACLNDPSSEPESQPEPDLDPMVSA